MIKTLLFKIFLLALRRFTGTGMGKFPPIKFVYKLMRQGLLKKEDIRLDIHGLKMYQHGRQDYQTSDETLFTDGYERMQTKTFCNLIKKGATVVDIGANIGYYTLLACRSVGEDGKVFAYEPDPINYRLLLRNIEINGFNNAYPVQEAICDKPGEIELYLSPKGHGEHSIYGESDNRGHFKVKTISLDESLDGQKIDIIKMDIEGAELLALQGMSNIAKNNEDLKMFIEFCPSHCKRAGYTPNDIWVKLTDYGFEYVYILEDKNFKLELSDCKKAIDRCGNDSSVNLLCSKKPVYFDGKAKIALLGAYPPPYGGVSVHVKRLKEKLTQSGMDCIVYIYKGTSCKDANVYMVGNRIIWCLKQLFGDRKEILHCHGYSPVALILFSVLAMFGKKIVLTAHGFLFRNQIPLKHRLAFWIASKTNMRFIATSDQVKEIMLSLGVKKESISQVIRAFIPPSDKNGDGISLKVKEFIKKHNPIITGNAYRIVFYNKVDLYGIDMCIEIIKELRNDYPNIGLLFSLPDVGNYEYFNQLLDITMRYGLWNNILFITEPCQFYPILKQSDVFVRPTNIDDYGISIAEAIYYGIPAVASDVCERAQGCILFKNRDIDDFKSKVKNIIENHSHYQNILKEVELPDYLPQIIEVYRESYEL